MTDVADDFLSRCGLTNYTRRPLPYDCSSRRYERVISEAASYILMHTSTPNEDIVQFAAIGKILSQIPLSTPFIHHADPQVGYALLEDFGDQTFNRCLSLTHQEQSLYELATDVLIQLHQRFTPSMAAQTYLPSYTTDLFIEQVLLFIDTALPVFGISPSPSLRQAFADAWGQVVPAAVKGPQSLLLRDYHVDNLMWLPARKGALACGLLDYQMAGIGPVSYDVVSLLEDARRDAPPSLQHALIDRYLDAFPLLDPQQFKESYTVLGALRHTRIIAVFLRQALTFNNTAYLTHLPRVYRYLDNHLQKPVLAPVKSWFDVTLPRQTMSSLILEKSAL